MNGLLLVVVLFGVAVAAFAVGYSMGRTDELLNSVRQELDGIRKDVRSRG